MKLCDTWVNNFNELRRLEVPWTWVVRKWSVPMYLFLRLDMKSENTGHEVKIQLCLWKYKTGPCSRMSLWVTQWIVSSSGNLEVRLLVFFRRVLPCASLISTTVYDRGVLMFCFPTAVPTYKLFCTQGDQNWVRIRHGTNIAVEFPLRESTNAFKQHESRKSADQEYLNSVLIVMYCSNYAILTTSLFFNKFMK